jgi:hypothetical protein
VALRAFLDLPDGMSVRIGAAGLLVGRHRSCDLQVVDDAASRRHALLRAMPDGVELVVLGKRPVHVGELACTTTAMLHDGDRVRLPGLEGRIRTEQVEDSVRVDYCLRRGRDRFQIRATPFVIGTGPNASVALAGWPPEAVRLYVAQGMLYAEALSPDVHVGGPAHVDGAPLTAEGAIALAIGSIVSYRGDELVIEQAEAGDASTALGVDAADGSVRRDAIGGGAGQNAATRSAPLPERVVLQPLPRGGRVTFTFADGDRAVYLPARRYRLVAALLQPPAPHVAGEFVPDHVIVPVVWNDDDDVGGRQEINVVLTRCRHDLVAAGIAPHGLLERAPGGRATRIVLAPGAEIRTRED